MKYIVIFEEYSSGYKIHSCFTSNSLQEVFEVLKYRNEDGDNPKAYKLGGEIKSMEDAVKKEV